jgi:hypothetical protein
MRSLLLRSLPIEEPPGPLSGYKLAYPFLSGDDRWAGFAGLSIGGQRVYGPVAEATCVWSRRHTPPKRTCSCGFYCFHSPAPARAMACETRYRPTVLLEVAVTGSFIRYHDGLRYGRQRVRAVRVGRCRCGRPATVLVDSGTGLSGWRQLEPTCAGCGGWSAALTFRAFAERLGGAVSVTSDCEPAPSRTETGHDRGAAGPGAAVPGAQGPDGLTAAAEPSLAVVAAEAALLQARLDELQRQLARLSDEDPPGAVQ